MIQRRQLFGAGLVLAGVVLFVIAMVGRVRIVAYLSWLVIGSGVWLISRRA